MLKRTKYAKIESTEISPNAPLDTYTLQKMRQNQEFSTSSVSGLGFSIKDLDHKEEMVKRLQYNTISGTPGEITFQELLDSSSGKGAIRITGQDFEVKENELYPISPLLGLGGFVIAKCTGSADFYFGLHAYDQNDQLIPGGERWFIADAVQLGNSYQIFQGVCRDYGTGIDQFDAATKYFLPVLKSTTNDAEIHLDSYGVFTLNYAKGALFQ